MKELSYNLPMIWKGVSHVRELGAYSFHVTFDSLEDMNKPLNSRIESCSIFLSDIRIWSEDE